MAYTNSPLAAYTKISPNKTADRTHDIDRITPHCFVGQVTAKRGCEVFVNPSRKASCNYVIGYDGEIGLCVEEKDRSWCTSNAENDHRAITFEIASETTSPYAVTSDAYCAAIRLMLDICKRYGKKRVVWIADKAKALAYEPKKDEILITVHRWFSSKSCPGDYIYGRLGQMADEVNERLNNAAIKETNPPDAAKPKEKILYRVQLGAYSKKENAEKQLAEVKGKGFDAFVTLSDGFYKVQAGAYGVKENANMQLKRMKESGFADAFVKAATIGDDGENAVPEMEEPEFTQSDFVRQTQQIFGVKETGAADEVLLSRTVTVSRKTNARHAVVTPLERYLKLLGYYLGEVEEDNGKKPLFGSGMEDAVRKYQKDNGCACDGEITAKNKTWQKLLGAK